MVFDMYHISPYIFINFWPTLSYTFITPYTFINFLWKIPPKYTIILPYTSIWHTRETPYKIHTLVVLWSVKNWGCQCRPWHPQFRHSWFWSLLNHYIKESKFGCTMYAFMSWFLMRLNSKNFHFIIPIGFTVTRLCPSRAQFVHAAGILKLYRLVCHSSKQVWEA